MLSLLLGVCSILSAAGFAGWLFYTRKQKPGIPLAAGAFLAAAITQTVWVWDRWHGGVIPQSIDSMWSLIVLSLVLSYAALVHQLYRKDHV